MHTDLSAFHAHTHTRKHAHMRACSGPIYQMASENKYGNGQTAEESKKGPQLAFILLCLIL